MIERLESSADPHRGGSVRSAGRTTTEATAALILVHGRGATAEDILSLADELAHPDVTYLAPQAMGYTWYPSSFLAPRESNEPGLSSGLGVLRDLVQQLGDEGIPADRIMLLGFSQGACLTLEFAYRYPRRYGGIVGLTGGLIGPPGTRWDSTGWIAGTAVYLGSGDPDPHVPWSRVEETAEVFERMGGAVTLERFPGMGHAMNREQLAAVLRLVHQMGEEIAREST